MMKILRSCLVAASAWLLLPAAPANADDGRFVIKNLAGLDAPAVERVQKQLARGLDALTRLGIPLRPEKFPITVRLKDGFGISNSRRGEGPITLFYVAGRSAPIVHELTHMMAGYHWAYGHWSPEGLASYVQDHFGEDRAFPTRKRPHAIMQVILQEGAMLPMIEVMKDRDRRRYFTLKRPWDNWLAYTQSSSFVKYLVETYGVPKFMAIYDKPFEEQDFQTHYGKPAETLIADWVAHVRSLDRNLTRPRRIFERQKANAARKAGATAQQ